MKKIIYSLILTLVGINSHAQKYMAIHLSDSTAFFNTTDVESVSFVDTGMAVHLSDNTALFNTTDVKSVSYVDMGDPSRSCINGGFAFVPTQAKEELDPSEPCSATYSIKRVITGTSQTLSFKVLENTNNVFTITQQPTFNSSDTIANFTFIFPKAEIGETYTLKLQIDDTNGNPDIPDDDIFTYTVTRVKWNLLGTGTFTDNFWYEKKSAVEIYEKDGDPTTYRVYKPFDAMAVYDACDGNQSKYVTLHILQNGETFMGVDIDRYNMVYFSTMNTGYYHPSYGADVKLYHPFDLYTDPTVDDAAYSRVTGYMDDDVTPGQIVLAPYYYMDGVGGWDNTTADAVIITFPGYTPPYDASILNDFNWQESITDGEFTSLMTNASKTVTLYQGTCNTDSCGCDTVFTQTYGTAYAIASPYEDGYNLYFCAKNGAIAVPADVALQKTGLYDPAGNAVYAKINPDVSLFEEGKTIILNITFQNEDGTIIYGTHDETLTIIQWDEVGTVDYVYTLFFCDYDDDDNEIPYYDNGLPLYQREDDPTQFKIAQWGYGVDFYFTWDQKTNEMTVPAQYTGYTSSSYGNVMVSDLVAYTGDDSYNADFPCSYDPETSVATVNLIYYVDAGNFGYGPETFTIHFNSNTKGEKNAKTRKTLTKKYLCSNPELKKSTKKEFPSKALK